MGTIIFFESSSTMRDFLVPDELAIVEEDA
jgi:hypothetical protein